MYKNRKIKFMIIIILIMLLVATKVQAVNLQGETTEAYKEWLELDNKDEYIEPIPFTVEYDKENKTYQKTNEYVESKLKATYPAQYKINGLKVKNQQSTTQCWAFSVTSVLESGLLKESTTIPEFSPRHINYATSLTFTDGTNPKGYNRELKKGGNAFIGLVYATNALGPILESAMPFENSEEQIKLSEMPKEKAELKVNDYKILPSIYKNYTQDGIVYHNGYSAESGIRKEYNEQEVNEIRNIIKKHIIEHGALSALNYAGTNHKEYLNEEDKGENSFGYYCNDNTKTPDHSITIVGWDDNYSKDNFKSDRKPAKDGAYIILNSYGTDKFNGGYMYVSYDDVFIERLLVGVKETSDIDYDNIYQHDELGYSKELSVQNDATKNPLGTVYAANVFNRDNSKPEILSEISYYMSSAQNVQIYVNTNDDNLKNITLVEDLGVVEEGYHTYKLKTPLQLTGQKFAVAMRYKDEGAAKIPLEYNFIKNGGDSNLWDTAESSAGETFVSGDKNNWTDLTAMNVKDSNVCIKAFTKYGEIEQNIPVSSISLNTKDMQMNVGDVKNLVSTITPENATNKQVKWSSSNETVAVVTHSGEVTALKEGETLITVETVDGAKTATCKVTVKNQGQSDISVQKIVLSTSKQTINIGESFKIVATVMPENAINKQLQWTSTDTSVVAVDNDGNVIGKSEGIATITVSDITGNVKESCVITVLKDKGILDNKGNSSGSEKEEPVTKLSVAGGYKPSSNGSNSNNAKSSTQDNTLSKTVLPKAGKTGVAMLLLFVGIAGMVIYGIKCYKNRDINDK